MVDSSSRKLKTKKRRKMNFQNELCVSGKSSFALLFLFMECTNTNNALRIPIQKVPQWVSQREFISLNINMLKVIIYSCWLNECVVVHHIRSKFHAVEFMPSFSFLSSPARLGCCKVIITTKNVYGIKFSVWVLNF
jgi:hypothetical protein